ncbi:hypothetical protein VTH06DRAFT_7406 [Thermothelomyces fergusii]
MSRASKLTLLGTTLFAASTVMLVHFQQQAEQEAMRQGVIRDMEQQRLKRERQADFDRQRELEAQYRREQTVRDTTADAPGGGGGGGGERVPGTPAG